MKNMALVQYYRQLGTMLASGVSIVQSLDSLGMQAGTNRLRAASLNMSRRIQQGDTFAAAFAAQGTIFPGEDRGMIAAAESSGRLDTLLNMMAEAHEQILKMRRTIAVRLIYPMLLVNVGLLAAAVLKWIPERDIMDSVIFLAWSMGILYGGWFLAWLFLFSEWRIGFFKMIFDGIVTALPISGGLCRALATAKLMRILEALYETGLAHPQAVKLAAEGCGNATMARKFKRALPLLSDGRNLADALAQSRALEPMHMSMIAAGDQSGKLNEMFARVAESCEDSAKSRTTVLGVVFPLALYLIIAGFVVAFIFRFYLGYFKGIEELI